MPPTSGQSLDISCASGALSRDCVYSGEKKGEWAAALLLPICSFLARQTNKDYLALLRREQSEWLKTIMRWEQHGPAGNHATSQDPFLHSSCMGFTAHGTNRNIQFLYRNVFRLRCSWPRNVHSWVMTSVPLCRTHQNTFKILFVFVLITTCGIITHTDTFIIYFWLKSFKYNNVI